MSGVLSFDSKKDIDSKISKVTTIIELLAQIKHYSSYKMFNNQKEMIKYMLNEMGLTEHTKHYNNRRELFDFINVDIISLLKKNEYIFLKLYNNDILLVKVFDEYMLRFVCCQADDIILKHNVRLMHDFFYIFTSKSENNTVIYNIRTFVNSKLVPFFDNYYSVQKKEIDRINRKLKSLSKEGRVILENSITIKINKNLFSEKKKYLDKVIEKVSEDIQDFYEFGDPLL